MSNQKTKARAAYMRKYTRINHDSIKSNARQLYARKRDTEGFRESRNEANAKYCESRKSEAWLPIEGYEGLYEVSDKGRVRSMMRTVITNAGLERYVAGKLLSQKIEVGNYRRVSLSKNGKKKTFAVHRLVAMAFLPNRKDTVNHKDGRPQNNNLENLEWCTAQENMRHAFATGIHKIEKGKDNPHYGRRGAETNRAKPVEEIGSGRRWGSLIEAAADLGINYSTARTHMHLGKGALRYLEE